jgi:hypothetical protein
MLKEYQEWREQQPGRPEHKVLTDDEAELLCANFRRMREGTTNEDLMWIDQAHRTLRRSRLPAAYVDGIRAELLQMIGMTKVDETFVYLAFWGMDGRSEFLKIGVAKDVKRRMGDIHSANPMDRLWTFKMPLDTRGEAMQVESALLRHMAKDRVTGEWIRLSGCSAQACEAIAASLAEVAAAARGRPVDMTVAD